MEENSQQAIFEDIPLFSSLTPEEQNLVRDKAVTAEYKKGEIIYQEGDPANAFYCIIYGRVVVYARGSDGGEKVLEYLHHGKYFGIISLLTGENHSVSVKAVNDSSLLVIKKDDFAEILKAIPRLAIDLSLSLSRRLKRKDLHEKRIFESTVISVFSSYAQAGKTGYALNLGLSLLRETHKSLIIIELAQPGKLHSLPAKLEVASIYKVFDTRTCSLLNQEAIQPFISRTGFGIDLLCLDYKLEDENFFRKVIELLSLLVNDYHFVIVDLPSVMDMLTFKILNQSDLIHLLTSPDEVDLKRTASLAERLKQEFRFQENKIKVIINEYKLAKINYQQQLGILGRPVFATLPKIELVSEDRLILEKPECEYARAVRRISRKTADCLLGLALGVGFAYGLCHIGVLKVLEDKKIPLDVISGSSIGALIASLWVTGRSAGEIADIISNEFREARYLWSLVDLTFPSVGFIKGNKLYKIIKKYLGNKTFYDVKLPLIIIASDIRKKESIVLNHGLLIDALMYSCSMPGIFTPFRLKEEILLDGGVINPLPTEVLFKTGASKVIAVNVTPSREDIIRQYEQVKDEVNISLSEVMGKEKKKKGIGEFLKEKFTPNILDLIFSSIEIMQSEVAKKEAMLADIVIHPDTAGLYWLDLHRVTEFAKRGEEETLGNLDKIMQLVNE